MVLLALAYCEAIVDCAGLSDNEVPVILVHGLAHGAGDMDKLSRRIRGDFPDRTVVSISILTDVLSTIFDSQDRYLAEAAEQIKAAAGGARCIDLIGHSQGGFISRSYI